MGFTHGRPLLWAALLSLFASPALAKGQLQAGPILLQMEPGQSSTRLHLSNTGDAVLAAQVRVYAWSQERGEDQLSASDSLVASPPIVELQPGARQVVRVVRLGDEAGDRDLSYRLVVDELPLEENEDRARVAVRMRYVLPLFVRARGAREPQLSCALREGRSLLECANSGGRAAQLGESRLVDESGHALPLSAGLFGYVLPGSRRVWALQSDTAALADTQVRLETRLNGQPATLPLHE